MIFRTLFFAFFTIFLVSADPLNVNIQVTCVPDEEGIHIDNWCGTMVVYEHDTHSQHDVLKTEEFCATGNKTFEYTFYPGGDTSFSYEVMYALTHNCTVEGLTRCIVPREPKTASRFFEQTVQFTVYAYEFGQPRQCRDPNWRWNAEFIN